MRASLLSSGSLDFCSTAEIELVEYELLDHITTDKLDPDTFGLHHERPNANQLIPKTRRLILVLLQEPQRCQQAALARVLSR